MITTREQLFTAATTRRQIRSRDDKRIAYVVQSRAVLGGATVTVSASQTGPGLILQPQQIWGRDIFAPGNEMWIECSAGTVDLYVGEDYEE